MLPVEFMGEAPGQGSGSEADDILANKTPYYALKSVCIGKKNLNTKLPKS